MGYIKMSKKELSRLEVIIKIKQGKWRYRKASQELRMSKRQLIRIMARYRKNGVVGIMHGNRGKPSKRKIASAKKKKIMKLIQGKYKDFGPTLATEQLWERHGLKISREWLRKAMIDEGIWKASRRKDLKLYQMRIRRSQEGELLQLDGSYDDWFESRAPKCCLLVAVDDATGKLQQLRFVGHESREDYMSFMQEYINNYGRPLAIYTDRHSTFVTTRKYDIYEDTQFARAMKELNIELIFANSPQAKGRVERANGVLQDRLIKLMRLENISSMEEGNAYLEKFLKKYNEKFAVRPQILENAHRSLPVNMNLAKILCVKEKRKLSKQLTLQFNNRNYQLQPDGPIRRRLIGAIVLVYEHNSVVVIEHQGMELSYTIYSSPQKMQDLMGRKEIMAFLDRKKPLTAIQRYRRKII